MRDFRLIFGVLFRNQFARRTTGSGKRKLSQSITTLLCMLPIVLLLCVGCGFIAYIIPDVETLSSVSNAIMSSVQIFVLFISMFTVMNTLYNSPDTPFLNTLPVKPTSVFFAKFALAYLNTLALTSAMLVPTLLTISAVYAAMGGAMFYGFFALILLIALVAPILPLFILTAFSMPISYIGTFFKGRAVLKTVLSLVFYAAIMVGYLLLVYFLGRNQDSGDSADSVIPQVAIGGLAVFSKVMYPNKVLLDFCLGISAGKNFGIWIAITFAMIAIMLLLAKFFYRRINEKQLETRAETSHRNVNFKQKNVVLSLMKKDFLHIVRNSHLAMTSFANIIICPIISAIMCFAGIGQAGAASGNYFEYMMKLSFIVMYTVIFLGGANTMAMLSYTREGKSFYLGKSLPIKARDSIKSKFFLSLIPSVAVLIIQIILGLTLYKFTVLDTFLFALCAAMTVAGAIAMHIYCDMRFGNVNWNTRQDMQQVSRGNKGSIFVSLWLILVGMVAMFGAIILAQFETLIGGVIVVMAIFWSILFVLSAVTLVAGVLVLRFKAEPYYNEIGEREYKPRNNFSKNKNGGFGGNKMLMK